PESQPIAQKSTGCSAQKPHNLPKNPGICPESQPLPRKSTDVSYFRGDHSRGPRGFSSDHPKAWLTPRAQPTSVYKSISSTLLSDVSSITSSGDPHGVPFSSHSLHFSQMCSTTSLKASRSLPRSIFELISLPISGRPFSGPRTIQRPSQGFAHSSRPPDLEVGLLDLRVRHRALRQMLKFPEWRALHLKLVPSVPDAFKNTVKVFPQTVSFRFPRLPLHVCTRTFL